MQTNDCARAKQIFVYATARFRIIAPLFSMSRQWPLTPRASLNTNPEAMGKKNTTTKKADAPAKRAAKPAAEVKLAAPRKAAPARKVAAPRKPAAKKTAPAFSDADIALRAYFVSEKRRASGLPGDEHSDWLEAERQLTAEHAKASKA